MAEQPGLSLEEFTKSVAEKTMASTPTETETHPTEKTEEPSVPTREEAAEELTPNLRRISESMQEDKEFTSLPSEAQKVILKRVENLEKAFHKDRAAASENQRIREQLEVAGVTVEDIQELIQRKQSGREVPAMQVTEAVREAKAEAKGLSRLMATTTDPAAREGIRELQDVLREEIALLLESSAKPVQDRINRLERLSVSKRLNEADTEIDELENVYPSSLLEKYRTRMRYLAGLPEFSGLSMEDILYRVASAKELREATGHKATAPPKGQPKKQAPAEQTVTSPTAPTEETEKFKLKKGRGYDLDGLVRHLTNRAMAKVGLGGR